MLNIIKHYCQCCKIVGYHGLPTEDETAAENTRLMLEMVAMVAFKSGKSYASSEGQ